MITDISSQLKRDEGWRAMPYADTVGKITIGYGRNLSDVGILPGEGEVLLQNDINHAATVLSASFPFTDALDDTRRGAMVNMTFNMGIAGLAQFKNFLSAMQAGDWERAATEMLDSKWAEQVGARAQRLAMQIRTGAWQ